MFPANIGLNTANISVITANNYINTAMKNKGKCFN